MNYSDKNIKKKQKTRIMAILNVTPDSFSGDGIGASITTALQRAKQCIADGASIIDVGGESTRPGAKPVEMQQEIARVVPIIEALSHTFPHIDISVDTYKTEVARLAINAGANIINDIGGEKHDPTMKDLACERDVALVQMHNKTMAVNTQYNKGVGLSYAAPVYNHFMQDVMKELQQLAQNALDAGIKPRNIILDPGIGFGKTPAQNMMLINHLFMIKDLGFSVLVGASRKSFIGHVLSETDPQKRLEGTLATTALALIRGADIIRVHDVRENARMKSMLEAMLACTEESIESREVETTNRA